MFKEELERRISDTKKLLTSDIRGTAYEYLIKDRLERLLVLFDDLYN